MREEGKKERRGKQWRVAVSPIAVWPIAVFPVNRGFDEK